MKYKIIFQITIFYCSFGNIYSFVVNTIDRINHDVLERPILTFTSNLHNNSQYDRYKRKGIRKEHSFRNINEEELEEDYFKGDPDQVFITIEKHQHHRKKSKGKKSKNRTLKRGKRLRRQNDFPTPQKKGTFVTANPMGMVVKIPASTDISEFDALAIDISHENDTVPGNTSTTSTSTSTTINATATRTTTATTTKPTPTTSGTSLNTTTNSPGSTSTCRSGNDSNCNNSTASSTATTSSTTTNRSVTTSRPSPQNNSTNNGTGNGGDRGGNGGEDSEEEGGGDGGSGEGGGGDGGRVTINKGRPEVNSTGGSYRGDILRADPVEVYVFYGIPYAAPPVDRLRFKKPFPPEPIIDKILDCTAMNPPCFPTRHDRTSQSGSYPDMNNDANSVPVAKEDCLYLNIWLPLTVVTKSMFPVLVWIHGEGFLSGMNNQDYESIAFFVNKTEIIVIAIQYRLGAFGFLHMDPANAPGNMGLLDQIAALKWIDKNVEAFGGNPNDVTIMGHDIGAAFVGFHLVSAITPSFFHRAVMLGGAPTQPHLFKTNEESYQAAFHFAAEVGCVSNNSPKIILECLMKLDAIAIWDLQTLFHTTAGNTPALNFGFVPTEDSHVLNASPLELLQEGSGKATQILIGVTANEGSIPLLNSVEGINPHRTTFITQDKFQRILNHIFRKFSDLEITTILHEYKNWKNLKDGIANQQRLVEVFGDYYFTCPVRRFADYWSGRGLKAFYYSFSQRSTALNRPKWIGTAHGDEIDFFFGVPCRLQDKFSTEEVDLSKKMMKILEDFIKTGKPGIEWERYGRETPHYIKFNTKNNLDDPSSSQFLGPRMRTCDFWNNVFPKIVQLGPPFKVKPDNVLSKQPPYNIDDHCVVTFSNCSGSNFAIYSSSTSNKRNSFS